MGRVPGKALGLWAVLIGEGCELGLQASATEGQESCQCSSLGSRGGSVPVVPLPSVQGTASVVLLLKGLIKAALDSQRLPMAKCFHFSLG